jgi:hypothetical protein
LTDLNQNIWQMNNFVIIPSQLQFKSAPIVDQKVTIDLNQTQKELTQYVRNTAISLPQLYQDERQASSRFRPTFKIQYLYNNTLTGTTGYNPFKNNLYYVEPTQSKLSGVWKGFPQFYEFDLFRPDVQDGHFDYKAESAYTYNWTYYVTYPAQNDYTKPMEATYENTTVNWLSGDGIPFIVSASTQGGANIISFQCFMPHNLIEGNYVELSFDYDQQTVFEVFSFGNSNYDSSNYIFNILNVGYTGTTFVNGRTGTFKRVVDPNNLTETRSKYYVRQNRVLLNENDIIVTKSGFELNSFSNERKLEYSSITPNDITRISRKTSSLTYTATMAQDVVLSAITDNQNRPVGEIFLSIVNKGYSGYFNKPNNGFGLRQGWVFNLTNVSDSWWEDTNSDCYTNIPVDSYTLTNGTTETFYYNRVLNVGDLIDGDFCEWNDYNQAELVVSRYVQKINFNQDIFTTEATPTNNSQGYYYLPHNPMVLRVFSDYIETAPGQLVDNIPNWAFYSSQDQTFRWREPYLYGEYDELDRGVNYPFLNRAHYPFSDQIFRLIPEGSNYQNVLSGFDIAVQPLIDDCE